jgi:hypothetical protein
MRRPVGVKWVLSFFRWTRFFSVPSYYCRHPSIRTLQGAIFSLSASWVFSLLKLMIVPFRCSLNMALTSPFETTRADGD